MTNIFFSVEECLYSNNINLPEFLCSHYSANVGIIHNLFFFNMKECPFNKVRIIIPKVQKGCSSSKDRNNFRFLLAR